MKHFAGAAVALVLAAPVSAATLDFSGDICGGPCINNAPIDSTYGSILGQLAVSYTFNVNTATSDAFLRWYGPDYSGLTGVAYGANGGRPEILFTPAAGYEVTIRSFQLGAWPNQNRTTQVSVLDRDGNALFASPAGITISGTAPTTFSGPWTRSDGLRIQWGPDGFNVGIDNIVFSVQPTGTTNVIPLPASLWLLGGGLVALLGAGRTRRRA
ncbi:hypothetical protein [Rhodobaculum claviforme]|uniref:VPLPA-CTERM protein sorting domain-containing protein n=1 Tax=Rhodobaculum claviforme TaxID=1549854 RepID=A0A934WEG7_9RHOB|nr:hypothetical protein [Rhodobaculum claviforme]MBK5926160.1 hypothetical protein [Rhodobaculum claviforme]